MSPLQPLDADGYLRHCGLDLLFGYGAGGLPQAQITDSDGFGSTIGPQIEDLARLHYLVRERRVTTVLEFGCGWSTFVMAHALRMNATDYGAEVCDSLRRNTPFELHSVDDIPQFIEIARKRLSSANLDSVKFHYSAVQMTTFNGRICTEYLELPDIAPDLIYLDAPSQGSVRGSVNGITTRHPDRLPMSCDILRIEHFLLPGTLILVDGRTANARFLRSNLQRRWRYLHDSTGDIHYFELAELPLGKYNRAQIEFSLGTQWLKAIDDNEIVIHDRSSS